MALKAQSLLLRPPANASRALFIWGLGMAWTGASPDRIRGRKWQAIRARILARDPICCECRARGKVTAASVSTIVDHIKGLAEGGSNDDANLQGLCHDCHDRKTGAEAARARGRRAPRERVGIGVDGWPTD